MASLQIAHVCEQGQDMIIVPLDEGFPAQPRSERESLLKEITEAAKSAGLKGTVVPVWPFADQLCFIAPKPWHPFFRKVSWLWVMRNINRTLTF